jgi:2-amino-4-hydroxy-6-hydroxymethyldihydropteridine diphosphokinase
MKNICYLSLGANQQDPIRQIRLANESINQLAQTHIAKASNIIKTPPFGVVRQQCFYNQVLQLYTHLNPFELLDACQAIEKRLGRTRHLPWGPRQIDIDILSYNQLVLDHPRLKLPHPQIWTRDFIGRLLAEIYY